MRRALMRVVTLVTLACAVGVAAGAADDPAKPLLGKWKADKKAMLASMPDYTSAPADKRKEMEALMPDIAVEFGAGTVTMVMDKPHPATYVVTKSEPKVLWIDVTAKREDGTTNVDKLRVDLVDADTLKMTKEGDPFVLVLNRQK